MRSRGPSNCRLEEPRGIAQLDQSLLRREPQDPRHVLQHVRMTARAWYEGSVYRKAGGAKKALERLPTRTCGTALDTRNDRLSRPGAPRKTPLTESCPFPRFDQKAR